MPGGVADAVGRSGPGGFLEAFAGVFQIAYVTHDRTAAQTALAERLGLAAWTDLDVAPAGAELAVAFARAGRIQIELIQPLGGDATIFTDLLPTRGLVAVHHLGVRVDDLDLAVAHADEAGYQTPKQGTIEGHLRFAFVDTRPDLAHFIELAEFTSSGWEFVAGFLED